MQFFLDFYIGVLQHHEVVIFPNRLVDVFYLEGAETTTHIRNKFDDLGDKFFTKLNLIRSVRPCPIRDLEEVEEVD